MFPAQVLFFLSRVRILISLQPKSKPIDVSLLRLVDVSRHGDDVGGIRKHDEIYRPIQRAEAGISLPIRKDVRGIAGLDAHWRNHTVQVEQHTLPLKGAQ